MKHVSKHTELNNYMFLLLCLITLLLFNSIWSDFKAQWLLSFLIVKSFSDLYTTRGLENQSSKQNILCLNISLYLMTPSELFIIATTAFI